MLQIVLGATLGVIGLIAVAVGGFWAEWLVSASGWMQMVLGIIGIRRNRKLDEADAAAARRSSTTSPQQAR